MSVTITYTGLSVADGESRTNDRGDTTAAAQETIDTTRRFAHERLVGGEPSAVEELVARVLGQAHRAAYAHGAPDEARVILGLAQLFADELAKTNPRFDRMRFIEAAVEDAA